MKKIAHLIIAFLFGLHGYSQETKTLKADIKKNQEEKKHLDQSIANYTKELTELHELNKSDTINTILYDFKTKKYLNSHLKPVVGESIIFKIQNINRLAYNIDIKSKDVAIADVYFNPEIKKALEKDDQTQPQQGSINSTLISNPDIKSSSIKGSNLTKDDENDFAAKATIIEKEKTKINENNNLIIDLNKINEINSKISKLENIKTNEIAKLKEKKDLPNSSQDNLDRPINEEPKNNEITTLEEEKRLLELVTSGKTIESITLENITSNKIINEYNVGKQKTRTEINDTFNKLHTIYKALSVLSQSLIYTQSEYAEYKVLALNPLLRKEDYLKIKKENKFLANIENSKKEINDFELKLINFYNNYNLAINNWSILDKLDTELRENVRNRYQTIKLLVDEINRNIDTKGLSNKLAKAVAIDNILQNNKAYEMTSSPIQPQEDYVTFEVEIKNRDDKSQYEYNDDRKFVYTEYTRGGIRFDFSTGVVFDFGNQTSTYELVNSGATNKKIIATSENDFTPTLAGMFHTSFRRCGIWSLGLTLGASLNVETFKLNSLFPGISLMIGQKQKFIITTGPAFKLVDTLKSNKELNIEYPATDFTPNSALTSEQFKIGFFVGLTYKLTNKQKGTFKISE
jgi:hypothetical protein